MFQVKPKGFTYIKMRGRIFLIYYTFTLISNGYELKFLLQVLFVVHVVVFIHLLFVVLLVPLSFALLGRRVV